MAKAFLITGASSGIGFDIVKHLANLNHQVYATARKKTDLDKLDKIKNVIPLELDVTKPDQILKAVSIIKSNNSGLYGLVNNAGLGGLGGFTTWNEAELQQIFDVNVYGPWRMTNALIDLLIKSQGRIVNIGSQGGMITDKYFGPYTMTKHALEAYTASLRLELEAHHVKVSIVQPGGIETDIVSNSMPGIIRRFKRALSPFKEEADQVLESFQKPPSLPDDEPESKSNRKPSSVKIVTDAVHHALFSDNPKPCYLVGTKWEGDRVINGLLKKIVQENDNPKHNYSRDELIMMLDKHLSAHPSN
jgi:short-subunit dehydrogenase